MTRRTISLIAISAATMLLVGILLPSFVEWITGRSVGAQQAVSVEPIDFQGGSSDLFSVLGLINGNQEEIALQPVKEGYRFTAESAAEHADELLFGFLKECKFSDALNYWSNSIETTQPQCDAMLVVVPDFPSPWSAIIWMVEFPDGVNGMNTEIVFDDATGTMLAGEILITNEVERKAFYDEALDYQRTKTVASVYAEGLGAEYEELDNWLWEEGEHCWTLVVFDSEGRRKLINLNWRFNEKNQLYLTLEPDGNISSPYDPTEKTPKLNQSWME